jgi:hypothetical protein
MWPKTGVVKIGTNWGVFGKKKPGDLVHTTVMNAHETNQA